VRARRLLIEGRVQGVGYRDWLVREATRLGLSGWVRNRADGRRVEAVVAGDEPTVQALLIACRRGPLLARVERIEESFAEMPEEEGFRRRPTA
jgi:acylphosphatase